MTIFNIDEKLSINEGWFSHILKQSHIDLENPLSAEV